MIFNNHSRLMIIKFNHTRVLFAFPLNVAACRNNVFSIIFRGTEKIPDYSIWIYNLVMIIFALLLAIFYNKIGDLFRFGFSFTGMLTSKSMNSFKKIF